MTTKQRAFRITDLPCKHNPRMPMNECQECIAGEIEAAVKDERDSCELIVLCERDFCCSHGGTVSIGNLDAMATRIRKRGEHEQA